MKNKTEIEVVKQKIKSYQNYIGEKEEKYGCVSVYHKVKLQLLQEKLQRLEKNTAQI